MKILITGGNSATALKLLKAFKDEEVILADYGDVPSFSSSNYKFKSLGIKNEDTIAHTLLNNCLDENIDLVLPLHRFEIEAVAKAQVLFNEFNIAILLPTAEDLEKYLNLGKADNWVVYRSGQIVFATNEFQSTNTDNNLKLQNGVFYVVEVNQKLVLSLITV